MRTSNVESAALLASSSALSAITATWRGPHAMHQSRGRALAIVHGLAMALPPMRMALHAPWCTCDACTRFAHRTSGVPRNTICFFSVADAAAYALTPVRERQWAAAVCSCRMRRARPAWHDRIALGIIDIVAIQPKLRRVWQVKGSRRCVGRVSLANCFEQGDVART